MTGVNGALTGIGGARKSWGWLAAKKREIGNQKTTTE